MDASGDTGYFAAMAVDSAGSIHAAYFDGAADNLLYRNKAPAGSWSAPQTVGPASDPPHVSMALGPDGSVHLAYYSNAAPCSKLCHAKSSGGPWSLSSVDAVAGSSYTSIAVDASGRPHIAYTSPQGALKHARGEGASWSVAVVDGTADIVPDTVTDARYCRLIALALDPAGKARIAYYRDNLNDVRYVEHDGSAWGSPEVVGPSGIVMTAVSLALDGEGFPRVVSTDFIGMRVTYSAKSAAGWAISDAAVSRPGLEPNFSAGLALDGDSRPHIAFHNSFNENEKPALGYLRYDGVSWSTMTVDESAGGATFASLALDGSGNPHFLYSDYTAANPRLMYASATAAGFAAAIGGGSGGRAQAPSGFAAAAVYYTSAAWVWTDNSSNETGFKIYGSTVSSGPFSLVASVPAGQASYMEQRLTHGTTYYRYVAAFNAGGVAVSSWTMILTSQAQPAGVYASPGQTLAYPAPEGTVLLEIPAAAFPGPVTVNFSVPQGFPSGGPAAGELAGTGVGVEITVAGGLRPSRELLISIPYSDASAAGMDQSKLIVARYDASAGVWVPLMSTPDPASKRVTGRTSHFSIFQVMASQPAGRLMSAKAFPNPLRPAKGHTSMTFADLPADTRLSIANFAGELVRTLSAGPSGVAAWDGRNDHGEPVASGVYFVLLQAGGERRVMTVAVQR
ncbi:MAG: hypothetical protein HY922_08480 [Elusimicrobia bacterium]|nr:hypothetical protein [Elusimicrobiota bacterium]